MTKQETIEKAYGECWDAVKKWVDENGWFNYAKAEFHLSLFFGTNDYQEITDGYNLTYLQRPHSLKGIDTNNGWIKLETIDDLPKEDCHCWIMDKQRGIESGKWLKPPTEEYLKQASEYWLQRVTYYQVMEKPEGPKY